VLEQLAAVAQRHPLRGAGREVLVEQVEQPRQQRQHDPGDHRDDQHAGPRLADDGVQQRGRRPTAEHAVDEEGERPRGCEAEHDGQQHDARRHGQRAPERPGVRPDARQQAEVLPHGVPLPTGRGVAGCRPHGRS